jgi:hypothetical protein
MRYLFAVVANKNEPVLATESEMAAIDAFNDKIEAAGQRILAVGISEPDTALTFDNRDDKNVVVRGPVFVAEEFMAGLWILEVDSHETAQALAAEASRACNRKIEIRQIFG